MKMLSDESGLTLVEMLVASAVLGILMLGLSQFYTTFVRASREAQAYGTIDDNLSLVMDKLSMTIKTTAKIGRGSGKSPFEFVGIDGGAGGGGLGFISTDTTPHVNLPSNLNDRSDRLHFHGLESKRLSSTSYESDRVYYAFWLNGEGSSNVRTELRNSWGILMRTRHHTGPDTLPRYPNSTTDQLSPVLNLNQGGTNNAATPVSVLGRNIDFLSFRYYDSETGSWYDNWDTYHSGNFPVDGRFPDAVQIAVRGYDQRADETGTTAEETIPPQWNITTVSLPE